MLAAPALAAEEMKQGTPDIQHAGTLAFAPDGVLLVGDSQGAAVFAIATSDSNASDKTEVNIKGIDQKIAAIFDITFKLL